MKYKKLIAILIPTQLFVIQPANSGSVCSKSRQNSLRSKIFISLQNHLFAIESASYSIHIENTLEDLVYKLDMEFQPTLEIASHITEQSPPEIPEIQLTNEEQNLIPKKIEDLKNFEKYFTETYKNELNEYGPGWHGMTSYQRMIWQDPEFLKAIEDPLTVKVILKRARNKEEKVLANLGGSQLTLSSALLHGLAQSRPSYLATAVPNWMSYPKIKGLDSWELGPMGGIPEKEEDPRTIHKDYLKKFIRGMNSVQTVLLSLSKNKLQTNSKIYTSTSSTPTPGLLTALQSILSKSETAARVTSGAAGASTNLDSMNDQSMDVMRNYRALLDHHNGDHSQALSYGIVSHALDARHLAAALHFLSSPQKTRFETGKREFIELIEKAKSGSLGSEANLLLKIRLQQIMTIIQRKQKELGLTESDLLDALSGKYVPKPPEKLPEVPRSKPISIQPSPRIIYPSKGSIPIPRIDAKDPLIQMKIQNHNKDDSDDWDD